MAPTAGWEKTQSFRDAPFRGIKLHLHEPDVDDDDGWEQSNPIWTFCCVYDSKGVREERVKAFLTKLVYVTEALRDMPWWREGGALSAQPSFAPTLQQQMESATRPGNASMLQQHVDETKAIMAGNIERVLRRGDRIEDLQAEAKELSDMSRVFEKRSKQLKRYKMWNDAKHGVMVGTAITGVVGAIVIPPLIALL